MSDVAALASTPRSIAQEQHRHSYRTYRTYRCGAARQRAARATRAGAYAWRRRRRCVRRPARLSTRTTSRSTRWFPRRWRRRVRGRWRTALREEESGSDRGEKNEASAYRVRERGRDATQAWRCRSLAQEQHTHMSGVAALASTSKYRAGASLRTGAAPRGPRGRGPPLGDEGDVTTFFPSSSSSSSSITSVVSSSSFSSSAAAPFVTVGASEPSVTDSLRSDCCASASLV